MQRFKEIYKHESNLVLKPLCNTHTACVITYVESGQRHIIAFLREPLL